MSFRTLDRYLFAQLLLPFGVALLTFVVLISGHFLWQATEIIVQHRISAWTILAFVALQIPRAIILAVPVATLLACSLTMNRMAAEHELTAMRAGGVSLIRLALPLALMATLASLFCLADSELLVPASDKQSQKLIGSILLSRRALSFRPRTFLDGGNGLHLYADEMDTRADLLRRVAGFVVPSQGPVVAMFTSQAAFRGNSVYIDQGRWYTLDLQGNFTSGYDLGETLDMRGVAEGVNFGGEAMSNFSLAELWRRARDLDRRYPGQGRQYSLELHWRLALAFSPLVFALLALPVTLGLGRRESLLGVLATIVVVFVYFVIMLWLRMAAEAGHLPPMIAAWLPNFIVAAAAALGLVRCR